MDFPHQLLYVGSHVSLCTASFDALSKQLVQRGSLCHKKVPANSIGEFTGNVSDLWLVGGIIEWTSNKSKEVGFLWREGLIFKGLACIY